jgi:hypothetical protein
MQQKEYKILETITQVNGKMKGYRSLTKFIRFDEPRCLICCAYAKNMDSNCMNDQCPQL